MAQSASLASNDRQSPLCGFDPPQATMLRTCPSIVALPYKHTKIYVGILKQLVIFKYMVTAARSQNLSKPIPVNMEYIASASINSILTHRWVFRGPR